MTRVTRTTWLCGSIVLTIVACNPVDPLQGARYVGPQNTCTDGCSDGASCNSGVCRAASVSYGLVLDVTPPTTAHYGGGTTFRFGPYANPAAGQLNETLSLARVSLRLDASGVAAFDKPIALSVELTEHAEESAPLPKAVLRRYEFRSNADELATLPKGQGHVSFEVPAGAYDLYISPTDADVRAVLPPVLRTAQTLTSGELVFVVGSLSTLSLTLMDVDPAGAPLTLKEDGWDVSVVDRASGRIVSSVDTTCAHPASALLRLSAGLTQHSYSVRFSPPANAADGCGSKELRPDYDFDLDALDITGTGTAKAVLPSMASVHATKGAPTAVNFGGWVVLTGTKPLADGSPPQNGVQSTILLRSKKITLPESWRTGSASFEQQTVSFSANTIFPSGGKVSGAQVVSGTYDIEIIPDLNVAFKYGVTIIPSFDLSSSPDDARTFFWTNPNTSTYGEVVGADGASDFGIGNVDFVPETPPPKASDSFVQATRSKTTSIVAHAEYKASCHVGGADAGTPPPIGYNFNALVDAGVFDVVVHTPPSSGFPWVVLQQVQVTPPFSCPPIVNLDKMVAVSPAQFTGAIVDENGDPVAFASVQARGIIVSADGATLLSAPIIGEARADAKGNYTLLVPNKLATFQTVSVTK